jgi:hypothetical protein
VGANDSSLLSKESLQLLGTTLHNWGHTIRSLGSTDASDDSDNEDEVKAGQQGASTHAETAGAAGKEGEKGSQEDAAIHDELQVRGHTCLLPGWKFSSGWCQET